MNAKEEVIAMMRSSVTCGIRPGSSTLTSWANTLEQAEQQTPPTPIGEACAGESSVQPTAVIDAIKKRSKERIERLRNLIDNHCDSPELRENYWHRVFGVEEMCWEAIECIEQMIQIEHEAKFVAAG